MNSASQNRPTKRKSLILSTFVCTLVGTSLILPENKDVIDRMRLTAKSLGLLTLIAGLATYS